MESRKMGAVENESWQAGEGVSLKRQSQIGTGFTSAAMADPHHHRSLSHLSDSFTVMRLKKNHAEILRKLVPACRLPDR
jgi:hypothetical protein